MWQAHALGQVVHQRDQAVGLRHTGLQQHPISHDDQTVTGQQGQRLAEGFVHRGQTAPGVGVVKRRHVVMHQRSAVHQFKRHSRRIGQLGAVVATRCGHRHAQLRADAGAARKHRMPHGSHQPRRGTGARGLLKMGAQGLLCACQQAHRTSEREGPSTPADRLKCQYNLIYGTVNSN